MIQDVLRHDPLRAKLKNEGADNQPRPSTSSSFVVRTVLCQTGSRDDTQPIA